MFHVIHTCVLLLKIDKTNHGVWFCKCHDFFFLFGLPPWKNIKNFYTKKLNTSTNKKKKDKGYIWYKNINLLLSLKITTVFKIVMTSWRIYFEYRNHVFADILRLLFCFGVFFFSFFFNDMWCVESYRKWKKHTEVMTQISLNSQYV